MWYRLLVNGQCVTSGPTQFRREAIAELVRQRAFGPVVAHIDESPDIGKTWVRLPEEALHPAWVRAARVVAGWWRAACAWSQRVGEEMD